MTKTISSETIQFSNGNRSRVIQSARGTPAPQVIHALALPEPNGLIILNGGTARLEPALQEPLAAVLADALARVVAEKRVTVITGGTDAGIFQLFGQGLARWGRTAPCIGVAVAELVIHPGHPQGEAPLEPNHSHFVLVEGGHWGDETETMYALAAALAHDCPSLAVFAGGGEIALDEMQANVAQGRTMLLLAGSGRNTDAVLAAAAGQPVADARLAEIARYPGIVPVSIKAGASPVHEALSRLLFSQTSRNP